MILLDTNILARSAQPGHSQYQSAIAAVDALRLRNETLCLVPRCFTSTGSLQHGPLNKTASA